MSSVLENKHRDVVQKEISPRSHNILVRARAQIVN